jgi:hypothetical protein
LFIKGVLIFKCISSNVDICYMLREGALWQAGKQILMFDEGKSIHMLQILTNEKIAVESRHEG